MEFRGLAARWRTLLLVALPLILVFPAVATATVQWTSGETISASGGNASQPDVAALPNGQAIAIWSRNDTSLATPKDRIQVSIRNSSGVWGTATTLSASTVRAYEPKIATNSSGDAVAVWTTDDGSSLRVEGAFRPSGGSFGSVQVLSPSGGNAFEPDVSIDEQGNAVSVWTRHDVSLNKDRIQAATRPAGTSTTFGAAETLSSTLKNAFGPRAAAEQDGNAVAIWSASEGTALSVQSSSRLDVPGYPRPQAGASFRVPLMIAYKQCLAANANRTHGPGLLADSCNPQAQQSSVLTVGTLDANGFLPRNTGFVKMNVCSTGTTGSGVCSTPSGMTSPDVRFEMNTTDVRCATTNTACPGGFGSDYAGKVAVRLPVQVTDKNNGTLSNDPATTTGQSVYVPAQCAVSAATDQGGVCNILTSVNAVYPGIVVSGKRAIWELGQIELKDAGPNGSGYAACPPTCGDGDEGVFERQGITVP